jgi:tripartite-type tricarboxylate transporter receptor subunit TctC
MAGIDMLHVPYRGMGPAVPDLLGGRIQLIFAPAVTVTPHIASGALRMIGPRARRARRCSGLSDHRGIGPAQIRLARMVRDVRAATTPPALVARISSDMRKVLLSDDLKKRLAEQGAEPQPSTPDEFKAFVNSDIGKWIDLADKAGIKLGG